MSFKQPGFQLVVSANNQSPVVKELCLMAHGICGRFLCKNVAKHCANLLLRFVPMSAKTSASISLLGLLGIKLGDCLGVTLAQLSVLMLSSSVDR